MPPDAWESYQLDLAAWTVGRWAESKLSERDKRGKPLHTLTALLSEPGEAPAQSFAPLAIDRSQLRKVRVKEDGTWDD